MCPYEINWVALSPCDRPIAVVYQYAMVVDILDSTTLQRLQTVQIPDNDTSVAKAFAFSPDSCILSCSTAGDHISEDRGIGVISWDLQTGGIVGPARQQTPPPLLAGHDRVDFRCILSQWKDGCCFLSRCDVDVQVPQSDQYIHFQHQL